MGGIVAGLTGKIIIRKQKIIRTSMFICESTDVHIVCTWFGNINVCEFKLCRQQLSQQRFWHVSKEFQSCAENPSNVKTAVRLWVPLTVLLNSGVS